MPAKRWITAPAPTDASTSDSIRTCASTCAHACTRNLALALAPAIAIAFNLALTRHPLHFRTHQVADDLHRARTNDVTTRLAKAWRRKSVASSQRRRQAAQKIQRAQAMCHSRRLSSAACASINFVSEDTTVERELSQLSSQRGPRGPTVLDSFRKMWSSGRLPSSSLPLGDGEASEQPSRAGLPQPSRLPGPPSDDGSADDVEAAAERALKRIAVCRAVAVLLESHADRADRRYEDVVSEMLTTPYWQTPKLMVDGGVSAQLLDEESKRLDFFVDWRQRRLLYHCSARGDVTGPDSHALRRVALLRHLLRESMHGSELKWHHTYEPRWLASVPLWAAPAAARLWPVAVEAERRMPRLAAVCYHGRGCLRSLRSARRPHSALEKDGEMDWQSSLEPLEA